MRRASWRPVATIAFTLEQVAMFTNDRKAILSRIALMMLLTAFFASSPAGCGGVSDSGPQGGDFIAIAIANPKQIGADRLAAERIPIGIAYDYKPCIALLPGDEILLVGFQAAAGKPLDTEYCFLYRSRDGGRTWSDRQPLDFEGREPYLSVTDDGVIFVSTHVLPSARGNTDGYTYCRLYRSDDRGRTWQDTKVPFDATLREARLDGKRPENSQIGTTRNVLQLRDGAYVFGVGSGHGAAVLWRSSDKGRTWDRTLVGRYAGPDIGRYPGSIHNEAFLFLARNGDILSVKRVVPEFYSPISGTDTPHGHTDQYHRLVLYRSRDGGANWSFEEFNSWYGEMYPSILRLADGRLIFTYTQRTSVPPNTPPLGVRAVLGEERQDGFRFDFKHDRILLDGATPADLDSGGGFGPTIQVEDGTLLTSYSYRTAGRETFMEVVRWKLSR